MGGRTCWLATGSASTVRCLTSGLLTLCHTLMHAHTCSYRLNVSHPLYTPDTGAQGESRLTGLAAPPAHSVPASKTSILVSTVHQKHSDVCKHHQT